MQIDNEKSSVSDEQILESIMETEKSSLEIGYTLGVPPKRVRKLGETNLGQELYQEHEAKAIDALQAKIQELLFKGMTQKEVAKQCGISYGTFKNLTLGSRPKLDNSSLMPFSMVVDSYDDDSSPSGQIHLKFKGIEVSYTPTMPAEESIALMCRLFREGDNNVSSSN